MKNLLRTLLFSLALTAAATASASTPVAGTDYLALKNPQAIDVPAGKIEVIEFFWYGCPHCNAFDPSLEAWIKRQAPDVVFKRVPVVLQDRFVAHSKMFHALDALGLAGQLTPAVFHEINENHDYLLTEQTQVAFLSKNGVDAAKYQAAFESFSTNALLQHDSEMANDYEIDGVPTLAVQGRYKTSPSQANGEEQALQVLDYLVAQVRAKKM